MRKMFSFLLMAVALVLPAVAHASPGDIWAVSEGGKEVIRVKGQGGAIFTSSGVSSDVPLWGQVYDLIDLPLASTSAIKSNVVVATGSLLNGTSVLVPANFTQPSVPRGISILGLGSTGFVQLYGYTGLGVLQTEIVNYSSGTVAFSSYPYAVISSITLSATSVNNLFPGATFWIGVSSRIALPNQIAESTAVYKVTENQVLRATYTVIAGAVSAIDIPTVTATNDYKIWMWIRKTLFVP